MKSRRNLLASPSQYVVSTFPEFTVEAGRRMSQSITTSHRGSLLPRVVFFLLKKSENVNRDTGPLEVGKLEEGMIKSSILGKSHDERTLLLLALPSKFLHSLNFFPLQVVIFRSSYESTIHTHSQAQL